MKQLYDMGYGTIKKVGALHDFVKANNAVLVDVRFSPRARNPDYNKNALMDRFGTRYLHITQLGNKDYKGDGIDFVDLEAGLKLVAAELEYRPVILMCACWQRSTCHRLAIVEALKEYGATSIPLTNDMLTPPQQPSLFQ